MLILAPTAYRQGMAGDVAGLVGGQEEHGMGHLDGLTETVQRGHAIGAVVHRLVQEA